MSNTALKDRIRIFNRSGLELASFRADVNRSWAIGYEGRASFNYASRKTEIVNESVLQFGNYLLIENSRLPAWVGIIDTPRGWDSQTVEVNAYTLERMFKYRRGALERKLTGSAGNIFAEFINVINTAEPTILQAGNIWAGGDRREETINPNTLERNLQQIQERSKEEYDFTPIIQNGKLVILANWYSKLGNSVSCNLYSASKGGNIEMATMSEDDEIINNLLGYGDGMAWSSRPVRIMSDTASITAYGLRQSSSNWNGVSSPATLDANNLELVTQKRNPRRIYQLTALNIGDTFDYIKLGNTLPLIMDNLGFVKSVRGTVTNVRIMGMSYNPQAGQKIKLVVTEII